MLSERLEVLRPTYDAIRRRMARLNRVLDTRTITAAEFQDLLTRLGISPGAVVMVHSSMDAIARRVPGLSPVALVHILQKALTDQGTVLMPTFPFTGKQARYVERTSRFDVHRTPSQSGLLTEVFRRMPGVLRSWHPTHPVAAWGRYAADLVRTHHLGGAFGPSSPIYRLREYSGLVIGIGCGLRDSFTILHVVEEIHPKAHRYFFEREVRQMTIVDGERKTPYTFQVLRADARRNYGRVERVLMSDGILRSVRAGGLQCVAASADRFIDRSMELVDEGRYL